MRNCLIVFAKEPEYGRVKTRLKDSLSPGMCLKLYKAFLKDTLLLTRAVPCLLKVLAYDSASHEPEYLRRISGDFKFYKQKGNDLGWRMHNAFKFAKRMNSDKTIIIGADSPNLPVKYIKEAYSRLDGSDIVLGPSYDGGYYLAGLKGPCAGIFSGVKWSTETVLKDTVKNAETLCRKISILKKWYDVDDYAGLALLKKDLRKDKEAAPWTRLLLEI